MNHYLFTAISGNKKTGNRPVTPAPMQTRPAGCPQKNRGCYVRAGSLRIHWTRITSGVWGITWEAMLSAIRKLRRGTLWRMNQAGDLPGFDNRIDRAKLRELTSANKGKDAICYTHYPVLDSQSPHAAHNREAIKEAAAGGFNINLSANNLAHADKLLALGIASVVAIVPTEQVTNCKTPNNARVVICPASVRDNVTCSTCGLCTTDQRVYVIAFPSHGTAKKTVNALALSGAVPA